MRGLIALLVAVATAWPSQAQDETYTLTLTASKVTIIWNALQERPHKEVAGLLAEIQQQLDAQAKARAKKRD